MKLTKHRPQIWVALFVLSNLPFLISPRALCAQQPQTQQGQRVYPVNAKYVNGIAPGYWPTAARGLTLNVSAGSALCGNPPALVFYSGGTLSMAASQTNYVYLDPTQSCTPASNTTGFPQGYLPLAVVVTIASTIVPGGVTDARTWFIDPHLLLGTAANPSQNRLGTSPLLSVSLYSGNSPVVSDPSKIDDSGAQPAFQVYNTFNPVGGATGKPWGIYGLSNVTGATTGTAVGIFGGVKLDATSTIPGYGMANDCSSASTSSSCYGAENDVENNATDAQLHSGPLWAPNILASLGTRHISAYGTTKGSSASNTALEGWHIQDVISAGAAVHIASSVTSSGAQSGAVHGIWADPVLASSGSGTNYGSSDIQLDASVWNSGSVSTVHSNIQAVPTSDITTELQLGGGGNPGIGISNQGGQVRFRASGIYNDGKSLKHIRVASPLGGTCPTGASIGASCTSASINWTSSFADNSYTLTCSLDSVTNQPHIVNVTKLPAGAGFTITIAADTAAAANAGAECIAIHD